MVKTKLQQAVSNLPERERIIVQLYYIESRSLKTIGRALGISESRASQLRQRALRRLRAALVQTWRKRLRMSLPVVCLSPGYAPQATSSVLGENPGAVWESPYRKRNKQPLA